MSRTMTSREKRLLGGCIAVLTISASAIIGKEFLDRRAAVETKIAALKSEKQENDAWLADRAFQEKRRAWLEANMPATDSLNRAGGELLEELQNQALDLGLKDQRPPQLNEPTKNANYQEVSVTLNVRGDQAVALDWMAMLQSPEYFQVIKNLHIDPDGKAKEKTPQAFITFTLARWFKPEGS
jgi:hypothetical protein